MLFVVMAAPAESGCVIHFCIKSDGILLEIGPKRLETITNCINEWIFTAEKPERTLSNHAKQAGIQIEQRIHDARLSHSVSLTLLSAKITHTETGKLKLAKNHR